VFVCVLSFTYFIDLLLFWLLSFAFVSFFLSLSLSMCSSLSLSLCCIDFFPCAPRSLPLQLRGSRRRRRRSVDARFATAAAAELGGGGGGGELEELE